MTTSGSIVRAKRIARSVGRAWAVRSWGVFKRAGSGPAKFRPDRNLVETAAAEFLLHGEGQVLMLAAAMEHYDELVARSVSDGQAVVFAGELRFRK